MAAANAAEAVSARPATPSHAARGILEVAKFFMEKSYLLNASSRAEPRDLLFRTTNSRSLDFARDDTTELSSRESSDQSASGSGRTWKCTTLAMVPLPVSEWNGV